MAVPVFTAPVSSGGLRVCVLACLLLPLATRAESHNATPAAADSTHADAPNNVTEAAGAAAEWGQSHVDAATKGDAITRAEAEPAEGGGVYAAELEERLREERPFEIAECVFNAGLAVFYLMRAGLEITAASRSCPRGDLKAACTMDIAGTIASFANAAAYFSGVAIACPAHRPQGPRCAMDIAQLVSGVAELASGVAGIVDQCNADALKVDEEIDDGDVFERRLRASGRNRPPEEVEAERGQEIAECFVDTGQSAFYLGHAGLEITSAVKNCQAKNEQVSCASEILGAISSFAFVATYLSSAAAECGVEANARALCAADISKVVAALTEIGHAATGIVRSCKQRKDRLPRRPGEPEVEPVEPDAPPAPLTDILTLNSTMDGTSGNRRSGSTKGSTAGLDLVDEERAMLADITNGSGFKREHIATLVAHNPHWALRLPSEETRLPELRHMLADLMTLAPDSGRFV
mmetsp:Transcript_89412/g.251802  ORF Transcript_89412/g.251802 Transcript_89412/m.251802 type:complete len:465 (-) Transcript_89412:186-1580(-)